MKLLFKKDHRLFSYERVFGSTSIFLPTLRTDAGFLDIEPIGSVMCTAFTAGKVASAETGKHYDYNYLWTQMVQSGKTSGFGASPQDAFAQAVKGLKVVPTGEIDTFPAYFRTDLGSGTVFDNVKSAIQMEWNKVLKRSVGVGTNYYAEWNTEENSVLPLGKTIVRGHEWEVCGWDETHPDCFVVEMHKGFYQYMPKDVFNAAMAATYGSVALTIAETSQEVIDFNKQINYSRIQQMLDFVTNTINILVQQLNLLVKKTQPAMTQKPTNMIQKWASIIAKKEGAKPELNNPGNFKYAPLIATWGATKGNIGSDGGNFAVFKTYEQGFTALINFLTLGCHDELKDYHNARTIKEFTLVYTNHPKPAFDYSDSLIAELGVHSDTLISTFLSS